MDSKSFHKPEGFDYCVCCYKDDNNTLYQRLSSRNSKDFTGNFASPDNVHGVILMPGVNKIRGKDVFVY